MRARCGKFLSILLGAMLWPAPATAGEPLEAGTFLVDRGVHPDFRGALLSAAEMLRRPGCRAVLEDFHDARGRTLQENLDELGLTANEYLGRVYWTRGLGLKRCDNKTVLATTSPGSRVVFVCGPQFGAVQRTDPEHSAHTLIHEMLHTLGLQENPPTPREITDRVSTRCGG